MFENIKNNIDFFIRNKTKFSRKNFVEKNEEKLLHNYLENLYTFDILEQCLKSSNAENAFILDIGSKNWYYAKGEYYFFKSFIKKPHMDGVELDAYRLYSNLYSRYETAKFYIKDLKNTNYIAGDFLAISKNYDYIVWFLPFVTKKPLRHWGLPDRYFMPKKLLAHAYDLLNPNGQMLIVNQGINEAIIQKQLLEELNIKYTEKGIVKSRFLEYKNDRYAFIVRK